MTEFHPFLVTKQQETDYNFSNCSLAFHVAYKELGIPPLLDVDDVVKHAQPDQRSILTYLSQFYHKLEGNASGLIFIFVPFNLYSCRA